MKKIIELKQVKKEYKGFTLGPIDLVIPSGVMVGLIGENGAGKTTLIKIILGMIQPEWETISLFEKKRLGNEKEANAEIGVVLDDIFFPELLNASDINHIMAGIYQNWDAELYQYYLTKFNLPAKKSIKQLSKGMKKKLELATALSHHPKLLILDEPTSGLDPVVRNEILDIFLDFIQDEDHTILFSTHITSDLEQIADQIVFLHAGEILLNQNRDDLLEHYGILKCGTDELEQLDQKDVIRYRKQKYACEVLIQDRVALTKKYPNFVIEPITLESLMVLYIKGVAR